MLKKRHEIYGRIHFTNEVEKKQRNWHQCTANSRLTDIGLFIYGFYFIFLVLL